MPQLGSLLLPGHPLGVLSCPSSKLATYEVGVGGPTLLENHSVLQPTSNFRNFDDTHIWNFTKGYFFPSSASSEVHFSPRLSWFSDLLSREAFGLKHRIVDKHGLSATVTHKFNPATVLRLKCCHTDHCRDGDDDAGKVAITCTPLGTSRCLSGLTVNHEDDRT